MKIETSEDSTGGNSNKISKRGENQTASTSRDLREGMVLWLNRDEMVILLKTRFTERKKQQFG